MAAVAVLRNETLQAFLQVCAQLSVYFTPLFFYNLGKSLTRADLRSSERLKK